MGVYHIPLHSYDIALESPELEIAPGGDWRRVAASHKANSTVMPACPVISYPLVNVYRTNWTITISNGHINYFDWASFNSFLYVYQRLVLLGVSINGTPKWMVYTGTSHWNGWFRDTPTLGNHHLVFSCFCSPKLSRSTFSRRFWGFYRDTSGHINIGFRQACSCRDAQCTSSMETPKSVKFGILW